MLNTVFISKLSFIFTIRRKIKRKIDFKVTFAFAYVEFDFKKRKCIRLSNILFNFNRVFISKAFIVSSMKNNMKQNNM